MDRTARQKQESALYIQLFRERLSEKVLATNPKGIVGGFGYLKEWHERPWSIVVSGKGKQEK